VKGERLRDLVLGTVGVVIFFGLWEILGRSGAAGRTFPPMSDVIDYVIDPSHRSLFKRAISSTSQSAGRGFLIAIFFSVALAAFGTSIPAMKQGVDRFAASIHAIPLIALGPIFIVLMSRDGTPTAVAALAAFFPIFVATASGMEAASKAHTEVFTALGADRKTRLRLLEVPTALPAFVDGLRLAAPAACLGAILGEWFGAPRGLGLLIVSAMQNFQIALLWSAALLAATISILAFAVFGALERVVVARYR
jgi:ABC-type nitrate/sulfonate/bicarbonate transport system permease component